MTRKPRAATRFRPPGQPFRRFGLRPCNGPAGSGFTDGRGIGPKRKARRSAGFRKRRVLHLADDDPHDHHNQEQRGSNRKIKSAALRQVQDMLKLVHLVPRFRFDHTTIPPCGAEALPTTRRRCPSLRKMNATFALQAILNIFNSLNQFGPKAGPLGCAGSALPVQFPTGPSVH